MTAVSDNLASEIAKLTPLQETPPFASGWGRDLSVVDDIDELASETDPGSEKGIAQAIVRRLARVPVGTLPDDPGYGLGLQYMLSKGLTTERLQEIAGQAKGEAEDDERVESVNVEARFDGNDKLTLDITITTVDPDTANFVLVLAVTSTDVILEALDGNTLI